MALNWSCLWRESKLDELGEFRGTSESHSVYLLCILVLEVTGVSLKALQEIPYRSSRPNVLTEVQSNLFFSL